MKKTVFLILAIIMLLTLAKCSGNGSNNIMQSNSQSGNKV